MNRLLNIGNEFPKFTKKAVCSTKKGEEFTSLINNFKNAEGRWTVMFWWPKDFTVLCPVEIVEFNKRHKDFNDRGVELIGASTDSEYVHLAWRKQNEDLKDLKFPMLADTSKSLAEELGILEKSEKVAYRATFIIDPNNIIRWLSVYDLNIGRNIEEVLRVVDALQTNDICPCNWQKGKETL